ncbi:ABC transporter substrate-binding protein [Bacillus taeanensis]|uniref:ABC transporter substrate-binding protein n=1 Tax=Bacillus taeanensis TaxID=273032 RepID=A0A366XPU8_9BACI|nr:ABC transporter substrate-binding protein [Bacillus taeanensis]RBW67548.1 ABC transporter substrate-binding protein [Bacillus taeanensis]
MKQWKFSKLFAVVMALMLVLAACSSGGSEEEEAGTDNGNEAKEEVVKLVYASGKDTTKATDMIIEEFNKTHPNIQVEFREMPSDSGAIHDAFVTALNAGDTSIDVMALDVVWPAEFAQAGYVLPLDRFIQQDGLDLGEYNQGAVSAASFNGKQWALPRFIDTGLLFYRTDLVSGDEVPQTWDDLTAKSAELNGQGGTKFGYLMQAKQYEGLVCNALEYIAAYGGNFLDENGNVIINSPEAIKGLNKLVEVANSDYVPANITTFTEIESHTAFIEGQSPFIRNWPYQWNVANNPEESKIVDKIGVAPLPQGDAGSAAALGGWMTAISKYSEHPKEAWEFVKFIAGKEGQKISAIHGGLAPTIPALFEDQEVLDVNPFFANEGFVSGLNAAVSRPVVPNYAEISEIIQIQVSKAIAGQQTVEEAVKNMETQMKEKLGK